MSELTYKAYCRDKRQLGEYYGYPKCCIDEFFERRSCDRNTVKITYKTCFLASKQSGFVPCKKHAEDIVNKKITLGDLISNRSCKSSFPKGNDDLLDHYHRMNRFTIRLKHVHTQLTSKMNINA